MAQFEELVANGAAVNEYLSWAREMFTGATSTKRPSVVRTPCATGASRRVERSRRLLLTWIQVSRVVTRELAASNTGQLGEKLGAVACSII